METNQMLGHVAQLSDQDLLSEVRNLAQREREATVGLLVHLGELEERQLYLAEGYPSLFAYCTHVLHLSEHATYNRIETARAARRFPELLEHLAAGWLHLTGARLLAPHLTEENLDEVLGLARHKTKEEILELIARLRPQPAVPDVVRKLPTRRQTTHEGALPSEPQEMQPSMALPSEPVPTAAQRAIVTPLAPERYKVQFTASPAVRAKLLEAQALPRHQIPDGDLEKIFDKALDALLAQLRKQKYAATEPPRMGPQWLVRG